MSNKRKEMGEEKWKEHQKLINEKKSLKYIRKNADKIVNWRQRTKLKLIKYSGGKCEICGYSKYCPPAYDFHHKNPQEKEFSISGKTFALDRLKKEVDKCMLLCKNCHAELHDKDFEKRRQNTVEKWKEREQRKKEIDNEKNKQCPSCRKTFKAINKNIICCSVECGNFYKRKVENRPSKEQLLEEIEETNYCAVGRRYGVGENTIRKWLK